MSQSTLTTRPTDGTDFWSSSFSTSDQLIECPDVGAKPVPLSRVRGLTESSAIEIATQQFLSARVGLRPRRLRTLLATIRQAGNVSGAAEYAAHMIVNGGREDRLSLCTGLFVNLGPEVSQPLLLDLLLSRTSWNGDAPALTRQRRDELKYCVAAGLFRSLSSLDRAMMLNTMKLFSFLDPGQTVLEAALSAASASDDSKLIIGFIKFAMRRVTSQPLLCEMSDMIDEVMADMDCH